METSEPNKPRNQRWSWRQYSLSTLLVVVTIVGVGLGLVTNRAERQRRAVAAIRELGGLVQYDFEYPAPKELPGPDWLCQMLGVDYFADVVDVHTLNMTDATCSHLSALTSVRTLGLVSNEVTDAGLAHLEGLTSLEVLYVDAQVTDAGLAYLSGLTSLQELNLSSTQVTDAGLAHLSGLTSLYLLSLDCPRVTDKGCDKLQQALPNCSCFH